MDKDGKVINPKKFVTVPLQDVITIERPFPVELHLVTHHHTYKLRMLNAEADEDAASLMAQIWFDRFVIAIDQVRKTAASPLLLHGEEEDDEGHEPWDHPPDGVLQKIFFYLTFPLKWCIFMTTPFVLNKTQVADRQLNLPSDRNCVMRIYLIILDCDRNARALHVCAPVDRRKAHNSLCENRSTSSFVPS